MKVYLGIDVGGTKTAVILSVAPPATLGRIEFATLPAEGPERAIQLIIDSGRSLLAQHGFAQASAVGVSCGSPLDRVQGIIQAPPNLSTWIDVPLRQLLEEAFQTTCRVENDANAGAVAEHRYGAGVGADHMLFLTLGTGLGCGHHCQRKPLPGGKRRCRGDRPRPLEPYRSGWVSQGWVH